METSLFNLVILQSVTLSLGNNFKVCKTKNGILSEDHRLFQNFVLLPNLTVLFNNIKFKFQKTKESKNVEHSIEFKFFSDFLVQDDALLRKEFTWQERRSFVCKLSLQPPLLFSNIRNKVSNFFCSLFKKRFCESANQELKFISEPFERVSISQKQQI